MCNDTDNDYDPCYGCVDPDCPESNLPEEDESDESCCCCEPDDHDTFVISREDFDQLRDSSPEAADLLEEWFPEEFIEPVPMELNLWTSENEDGDTIEHAEIVSPEEDTMVSFINRRDEGDAVVDTMVFSPDFDWDVQYDDDGRLLSVTAVVPNGDCDCDDEECE